MCYIWCHTDFDPTNIKYQNDEIIIVAKNICSGALIKCAKTEYAKCAKR